MSSVTRSEYRCQMYVLANTKGLTKFYLSRRLVRLYHGIKVRDRLQRHCCFSVSLIFLKRLHLDLPWRLLIGPPVGPFEFSKSCKNRMQLISKGDPVKREEAIDVVKAGFEKLEESLKQGKSDALLKYLATVSKFHNYSMRNLLLIWQQNEDATMVAGFRAWQKHGRSVKKGDKGIGIFAPMPFKKKDQDGNPSQGKSKTDEETQMMGFRVVHVFDISQTEGDPLPKLCLLYTSPSPRDRG